MAYQPQATHVKHVQQQLKLNDGKKNFEYGVNTVSVC